MQKSISYSRRFLCLQKSITGTGLLLAVAPYWRKACASCFHLFQNQVSMFPHRFHYICYICACHVALWLEEWISVIAWIATSSAHLQGMLPLPPFILITALGMTAYVFVAHWLQHKPKGIAYHCGGFGKSRRTLWRYSLFSPCSNFHQRL